MRARLLALAPARRCSSDCAGASRRPATARAARRRSAAGRGPASPHRAASARARNRPNAPSAEQRDAGDEHQQCRAERVQAAHRPDQQPAEHQRRGAPRRPAPSAAAAAACRRAGSRGAAPGSRCPTSRSPIGVSWSRAGRRRSAPISTSCSCSSPDRPCPRGRRSPRRSDRRGAASSRRAPRRRSRSARAARRRSMPATNRRAAVSRMTGACRRRAASRRPGSARACRWTLATSGMRRTTPRVGLDRDQARAAGLRCSISSMLRQRAGIARDRGRSARRRRRPRRLDRDRRRAQRRAGRHRPCRRRPARPAPRASARASSGIVRRQHASARERRIGMHRRLREQPLRRQAVGLGHQDVEADRRRLARVDRCAPAGPARVRGQGHWPSAAMLFSSISTTSPAATRTWRGASAW